MISDEEYIQLDSFKTKNKEVIPIARLKCNIYGDKYIFINYEVVSFKIIEGDDIYYKNLNLSIDEFETVISN